MNFPGWHCTRREGHMCPAEGCPASYGCAIEQGWSQGQPVPPECQGLKPVSRSTADEMRVLADALREFGAAVSEAAARDARNVARFLNRLNRSPRAAAFRSSVFDHDDWSIVGAVLRAIHPAAWFVITAVVSFTVGMLVF